MHCCKAFKITDEPLFSFFGGGGWGVGGGELGQFVQELNSRRHFHPHLLPKNNGPSPTCLVNIA